MRFILFTKTNWDEAPRLRHQVAELLASHGHAVVFFQRPWDLGRRRPATKEDAPAGIRLQRTRQLLHHQLRVAPLLAGANALYETGRIHEALRGEDPPTAIINFNYDYFFLRDAFPGVPIVSVFNDDFIDGARLSRKQAERAVRLTSTRSMHNLVVSYPLLDQVRRFTDRVSLFLPWARRGYAPGRLDATPRDLLYWGYIGDRIDFPTVESLLASGVRIHFVGPIIGSERAHQLVRRPNATYHGLKSVTELGPIAEQCVASILPYDATLAQLPALTMSNRGFDLLSWGLPLIYGDLPGLLRAPEGLIYRCKTPRDYLEAVEAARERSGSVQGAIRDFLQHHTAEVRYRQILDVLGPVST
jgi:hypothetical protein